MVLSTLALIACGPGFASSVDDSPEFYMRTIRQVCESHGTDPKVFQYWFAEPKIIKADQEGFVQFSFGANAGASLLESRGRFYFASGDSPFPKDAYRERAWSEDRCRDLAQSLLIALRPGTLWRFNSVSYNEFALMYTYTFDAVVGGLSLRMPRIQPYGRVIIDAAMGALYLMDIDAHSVTADGGDLVDRLSDAQYRARAEAAYASFRPYAHCEVRTEPDIVVDPSRLAYLPHSFTPRHRAMIAEKRGLRVHTVRFARSGLPPRQYEWQWVMLDALDGRPIAIIEERNSFRDTGDAPAGVVPDIAGMKFRALGSSSKPVSLSAADDPMPDGADQAVVLAQDGSLWQCELHLDSGLVRLKANGKVYAVSAGMAREIAQSVKVVREQPKLTVTGS